MANDSSNSTSTLEAARSYRNEFGWSIFPVVPGTKKPMVRWGEFQRRLPTLKEIEIWWTREPDAGIGLATGLLSGIITADLDLENHKRILDRRIADEFLVHCVNSPVSRTRNGYHFLSRFDERFQHLTRNGYHFLSRFDERFQHLRQPPEGMDIKGQGGFVKLPPSKFSDGGAYEWLREPVLEIPEFPAAIFERLETLSEEPQSLAVSSDATFPDNGVEDNNRIYPVVLDEFFESVDTVNYLMFRAGAKPTKLEKPFRCVFPGHLEDRESAAWHKFPTGSIMYHDFHRRSGKPWWTIGEVFHALRTRRLVQLKTAASAQECARLALEMGYKTPELVALQTKAAILAQAIPNDIPTEAKKTFDFAAEHICIESVGGFLDGKLSSRFVANGVGITVEKANRSVNLLCCLGLLRKTPGSGGMRGDRFRLGDSSRDEIAQRWEVLGKPKLTHLNRKLVGDTLSIDFAASIFRRQADWTG